MSVRIPFIRRLTLLLLFVHQSMMLALTLSVANHYILYVAVRQLVARGLPTLL
jgi:hypothetical protein